MFFCEVSCPFLGSWFMVEIPREVIVNYLRSNITRLPYVIASLREAISSEPLAQAAVLGGVFQVNPAPRTAQGATT